MKLTRRGHYMPQALQANAHLVHHVVGHDPRPRHGHAFQHADRPARYERRGGSALCIVLLDGDRVTGVLPRDWALGHPSKLRAARKLGDVALHDYVTISDGATIVDLLALLVATHASRGRGRVIPRPGAARAAASGSSASSPRPPSRKPSPRAWSSSGTEASAFQKSIPVGKIAESCDANGISRWYE